MILSVLEEDYLKQGNKPSILLLSFETYYELIQGDRAMETCFRIDKHGRLGTKISGCPTYVVEFLDIPYQWLS